jgi:hypothetical protein
LPRDAVVATLTDVATLRRAPPGGSLGRLRDAVLAGIASWGLVGAFAVALAATAAQLVDFRAYGLRLRILDMDTHASVFGAASLLALAAAVAMAMLLAVAPPRRNRAARALPQLLAVLLALRVVHPSYVIFAALPFAAATFVVLWRHAAEPDSRAQRVIRAGCLMLVGSYVLHAFGHRVLSELDYGADSWPFQITFVIRHSTELAGWMVVATGLADVYASLSRPA